MCGAALPSAWGWVQDPAAVLPTQGAVTPPALALSCRTTSDMTKVFCPHCGNKTLKKVAVSVSEDGSLHMHFSRNPKVLNPRGLRVSGCA